MIIEPKCRIRKCLHFRGLVQTDGTELTEKVVCEAFPNGIPHDIAFGRNKHLELRGDEAIPIIFTREEKTD